MRREGEILKEAYIRYVDTLGNAANFTLCLSTESWKNLSSYWPRTDTIKRIQTSVASQRINFVNLAANALLDAHTNLLAAIEEVVRITGSAVFEGKEELAEEALFNGYSDIDTLVMPLRRIAGLQPVQWQSELEGIQNELRKAAIAAGEILLDLCALAKEAEPLRRHP